MSQLCSLGEKNYFVHIHILREIFENVKVITRVITRVITNSLECCHEVRIGKQNVHANKVYADMERQKICIRACKLSGLQVSGLPCPSL